jgi:hypothetical protein
MIGRLLERAREEGQDSLVPAARPDEAGEPDTRISSRSDPGTTTTVR